MAPAPSGGVKTLAQLSVVVVSLVSLTLSAGCGYTRTVSASDAPCHRSKAGCGQPRNESTTTVTSAPATSTFLPPSQPPGTPTNQPAAFANAPMAPPPTAVAMGTSGATPTVTSPEPVSANDEASPARPAPRPSSKKARRAPAR